MTTTTLIQPKKETNRTVYFHRVFIARENDVTVIERTGVQTAETDIVNENRRYTLTVSAARAEYRRLITAGYYQF
jgi:hypothetical protein